MEACTHCLLLIMCLESASDLLLHLEILCLNTNASQPHCRSLQRLMPHTSLPLDCTQRQKWIDFEFRLKVNRRAVHFARKSSPCRATRHSTSRSPKKTQETTVLCISSYTRMVVRSKNKGRLVAAMHVQPDQITSKCPKKGKGQIQFVRWNT